MAGDVLSADAYRSTTKFYDPAVMPETARLVSGNHITYEQADRGGLEHRTTPAFDGPDRMAGVLEVAEVRYTGMPNSAANATKTSSATD